MPITAQMLRDIMAEARPIIERQMNDAKLIAGFRDLIASNGGDWSALKALIKAHVEDEADDDGEGKRVRKILDKADSSTAYADMLGLAKMNEEKKFQPASYSEAKGRGFVAKLTDEQMAAALAYDGEDSPVGELTDNQDQIGGNGTDLPVEAATEKQAAGTSRPTLFNSPDDLLPVEADTATGAASSSPAPVATKSDDIDLTIPDFLKRTDGYPKREAVEAV